MRGKRADSAEIAAVERQDGICSVLGRQCGVHRVGEVEIKTLVSLLNAVGRVQNLTIDLGNLEAQSPDLRKKETG